MITIQLSWQHLLYMLIIAFSYYKLFGTPSIWELFIMFSFFIIGIMFASLPIKKKNKQKEGKKNDNKQS